MRWLIALGTVSLLLGACGATTTATAPAATTPAATATAATATAATAATTAPTDLTSPTATAAPATSPKAQPTPAPTAAPPFPATAPPTPAGSNDPTEAELNTFDRIGRAEVDGRLDAETSLLYRVFAAFDDARLPGEYRGSAPLHDASWVMRLAAARYATLSAERQQLIAPFLIPPYYEGSWWSRRATAIARSRPGAAVEPQCVPIDPPQEDAPDCPISQDWAFIDAVGGKVRLWTQNRYPRDAVLAANLADELAQVIWPKLTGLMGRAPLSDAGSEHDGGSAALDIAFVDGTSHAGITYGYRSCDDPVAAYILIDRQATTPLHVVAAHELMHAIQYSYDPALACDTYLWLSEATAAWAEDYVYPDQNTEHDYAQAYLDSASQPLVATGPVNHFVGGAREYGGYLFFQYLARRHAPTLIPAVWDRVDDGDDLLAIDGAIPGGLADVWPAFAKSLWNQDEWGDFRAWDGLTATPKILFPFRPGLGGYPSISLYVGADSINPISIQYVTVDFTSDELSSVAWRNGLLFDFEEQTFDGVGDLYVVGPTRPEGSDRRRVQALIQLSDGSWHDEDWTDRAGVVLCRDRLDERITRLVLISTDARFERPAPAFHIEHEPPILQLSNLGCWRWSGVLEQSLDGPESRRIAIRAEVTFEAVPRAPVDPGWVLTYELTRATVRWEASGVWQPCTHGGDGEIRVDRARSDFTTFTFVTRGPGYRAFAGSVRFVDPVPQYTIQCGSDPATHHDIGYLLSFPVSADLVAAGSDGRVIDGRYVDASPKGGTVTSTWHLEAQRQ